MVLFLHVYPFMLMQSLHPGSASEYTLVKLNINPKHPKRNTIPKLTTFFMFFPFSYVFNSLTYSFDFVKFLYPAWPLFTLEK